MHKKMTITLDEDVYCGLYQMVGRRKISQFIEDLVRPYVLDSSLDAGYKAMADQIMAANKAKLKNKCGKLSKADILTVEDAILLHLGLPR